MTFEDIEHGTYGGYQQHRIYGIDTTDSCGCVDARNAYMRDYRASRPDVRLRQRQQAKARLRALSRLAGMHRRDYRRLMAEELAKVEHEES